MNSNVVAIIPARGGSKGIPRKNVRLLCGKPLIAYTIEAALSSKLIDRVVVSTEDEEIAEVSKKYGAEVIRRPPELAQDDTPSLPVCQHAIRHLEEVEDYRPEIIVILQPTSPLRVVEDIDRAIEGLLEAKYDSVVSVCEVEYPSSWMYTLAGNRLKPVIKDGESVTRRQDATKVYRLNGAVYVASRDIMMKENRVLGRDPGAHIMPLERSIDINTEPDFELADLLMRERESQVRMKVKIANRLIGGGEPCFIVAEAGINHNGDVNLAKKLIHVAKDAGADAVKFQSFKAENVVTRKAPKAKYQKQTAGSAESQYEMIKKLELSAGSFEELARHAQKDGIIFLSTPFDNESVNLLDGLGVPAFKIASGEITNFPLLKHIAQKKKPVILSTGMSTLGEINEALRVIQSEGMRDIILLHCVTAYPAKVEDVNLNAMETLRCEFKLPVGLSDHTIGITVPIAAIALGACVVEKHFTLDKSLPGPDHRASLDPGELKQMVQAIRDVEKALGDGIKRPTKEEGENRKAARRSIVARVDISEGAIITGDMLAIKRPGSGIEPKHVERIVGAIAKANIREDDRITWSKIQVKS